MASEAEKARWETLARVLRERFGDPTTAEAERPKGLPPSTPEQQEERRRCLVEALDFDERHTDRA